MPPHPKHVLLIHGTVLVLLGLLTGAALPIVTNPRMGLSAHLGGVMNGMLTLILGMTWPYARLASPTLDRVTTWLLLYAMYGIWAFTLLGAVFGTSATNPIAGEGFSGAAWQEHIVTVGLTTGALAILTATVVLVSGFARARSRDRAQA